MTTQSVSGALCTHGKDPKEMSPQLQQTKRVPLRTPADSSSEQPETHDCLSLSLSAQAM